MLGAPALIITQSPVMKKSIFDAGPEISSQMSRNAETEIQCDANATRFSRFEQEEELSSHLSFVLTIVASEVLGDGS